MQSRVRTIKSIFYGLLGGRYMKFQPVIKWSGSKRSQSETIVSKIERK